MSDDLSRRQMLAGGAAAALAGLSGCVSTSRDETETVTETYPVDGLQALDVTNTNGDVTIRGEDRADVAVRGEKAAGSRDGLDSIRLTDDRDGSTLDLTVESDDGPFLIRLGPPPRMDLEIAVPTDLRVANVETVNGDVEASAVRGRLDAVTTNGDVTLTDVRGGVTAETTNGAVDVTGIEGDVTAETTNGAVEVTGVDGDVNAMTTNGDITVRDVVGTVVTDTTNGDVEVQNASEGVSQG